MRTATKTLSVLTAAAYFSTQVAFGALAESNVWKERRAVLDRSRVQLASAAPLSTPVSTIATPRLGRLMGQARVRKGPKDLSRPMASALAALPASAVTIRDIFDAGSGAPLVVLQDIHLNPEAQAALARALDSLSREGTLDAVSAEGAFGPFDFSAVRAFPDENAVRRVADDFLAKGRLSAVSLFGITSPAAPPAVDGWDDPALYAENAKAYLDSRSAKPAVDKALADSARTLADAKAKHFSPAMARWDQSREDYEAGRLGLGAYLAQLCRIIAPGPQVSRFLEARRLETNLDFNRAESERMDVVERLLARLSNDDVERLVSWSVAFRRGELSFGDYYGRLNGLCRSAKIDLARTPAFESFLRYAMIADGIDAYELFEELGAMSAAAADKLALSPQEKEVARRSADLTLVRKISEFSLTSTEWQEYQKRRRLWNLDSIPLDSFERFYRAADERSAFMVRRILDRPAGERRAIIVGGFHTEDMTERLKAAGRRYIVATPRLTKTPDGDGAAYLTVFAQERTPLDRLFAGEKLFLGPGRPHAMATRTPDALSTTTALLAAAAAHSRNFQGSPGTGTKVHRRGAIEVAVRWMGTRTRAFFLRRADRRAGDPPPHDQIGDMDVYPTDPRESPALLERIRPDPAIAPGAWGAVWAWMIPLLERRFTHETAGIITFTIAAISEGAIAGLLIRWSVFSGWTLVGTAIGWVVLNIVMHSVAGHFRWDFETRRWELVRGRVGLSYFKANYIAIGGTMLAVMAAALGYGTFVTMALAIVPHAVSTLHRERRLNQIRHDAIREQQSEFDRAGRSLDSIQNHPDLSDDGIRALAGQLLGLSPLAALRRFGRNAPANYRIAMLMHPGSTETAEGPGVKRFNDTLGIEVMNRIGAHRNRVANEEIAAVFGADAAKNGVVIPLYETHKSVVFAIDEDAYRRLERPRNGSSVEPLSEKLEALTNRIAGRMTGYLSEELPDGSNRTVVAAARAAGMDVSKFPLFWGLSAPARAGRADEPIVRDAEALSAINLRRAERDDASRGAEFTNEALENNLLQWKRSRDELIAAGLIGRRAIAGPEGTTMDRMVVPKSVTSAFRKYGDDVQGVKAVTSAIAAATRRAGRAAPDVDALYRILVDYYRRLAPLDITKPWVGRLEKQGSEQLADEIIGVVEELERIPAMDAALRPAAYAALNGRIEKVVSRHPRATFLGSKTEFYGRPALRQRTSDERQAAVVFVDFRDFGGMIVEQMEATADDMLELADDRASLRDAYEAAVLTMGDNVLDPFAESLRRIRKFLADQLNDRADDDKIVDQFGGDDLKMIVPIELVYTPDGRLRTEILEAIFERVPAGMLIRITIASTLPYRHKEDLLLATAIAVEDADELANDAKETEKIFSLNGAARHQVVFYMDPYGARRRIVATPNGADASHPPVDLSGPQLVTSAPPQGMNILLRFLTSVRQWFVPGETRRESREWAERMLTESIIVLAAGAATVELPLLPGLALWLSHYMPVGFAAMISAAIIVTIHELVRYRAEIRRWISNVGYRMGLTDRAPPPAPDKSKPPFSDHPLIRIPVRFVMATMISLLAVAPLHPLFFTGVALNLFTTAGLLSGPLFPVFAFAWMLHAVWNSFAPPAWRLSIAQDGTDDTYFPFQSARMWMYAAIENTAHGPKRIAFDIASFFLVSRRNGWIEKSSLREEYISILDDFQRRRHIDARFDAALSHAFAMDLGETTLTSILVESRLIRSRIDPALERRRLREELALEHGPELPTFMALEPTEHFDEPAAAAPTAMDEEDEDFYVPFDSQSDDNPEPSQEDQLRRLEAHQGRPLLSIRWTLEKRFRPEWKEFATDVLRGRAAVADPRPPDIQRLGQRLARLLHVMIEDSEEDRHAQKIFQFFYAFWASADKVARWDPAGRTYGQLRDSGVLIEAIASFLPNAENAIYLSDARRAFQTQRWWKPSVTIEIPAVAMPEVLQDVTAAPANVRAGHVAIGLLYRGYPLTELWSYITDSHHVMPGGAPPIGTWGWTLRLTYWLNRTFGWFADGGASHDERDAAIYRAAVTKVAPPFETLVVLGAPSLIRLTYFALTGTDLTAAWLAVLVAISVAIFLIPHYNEFRAPPGEYYAALFVAGMVFHAPFYAAFMALQWLGPAWGLALLLAAAVWSVWSHRKYNLALLRMTPLGRFLLELGFRFATWGIGDAVRAPFFRNPPADPAWAATRSAFSSNDIDKGALRVTSHFVTHFGAPDAEASRLAADTVRIAVEEFALRNGDVSALAERQIVEGLLVPALLRAHGMLSAGYEGRVGVSGVVAAAIRGPGNRTRILIAKAGKIQAYLVGHPRGFSGKGDVRRLTSDAYGRVETLRDREYGIPLSPSDRDHIDGNYYGFIDLDEIPAGHPFLGAVIDDLALLSGGNLLLVGSDTPDMPNETPLINTLGYAGLDGRRPAPVPMVTAVTIAPKRVERSSRRVALTYFVISATTRLNLFPSDILAEVRKADVPGALQPAAEVAEKIAQRHENFQRLYHGVQIRLAVVLRYLRSIHRADGLGLSEPDERAVELGHMTVSPRRMERALNAAADRLTGVERGQTVPPPVLTALTEAQKLVRNIRNYVGVSDGPVGVSAMEIPAASGGRPGTSVASLWISRALSWLTRSERDGESEFRRAVVDIAPVFELVLRLGGAWIVFEVLKNQFPLIPAAAAALVAIAAARIIFLAIHALGLVERDARTGDPFVAGLFRRGPDGRTAFRDIAEKDFLYFTLLDVAFAFAILVPGLATVILLFAAAMVAWLIHRWDNWLRFTIEGAFIRAGDIDGSVVERAVRTIAHLAGIPKQAEKITPNRIDMLLALLRSPFRPEDADIAEAVRDAGVAIIAGKAGRAALTADHVTSILIAIAEARVVMANAAQSLLLAIVAGSRAAPDPVVTSNHMNVLTSLMLNHAEADVRGRAFAIFTALVRNDSLRLLVSPESIDVLITTIARAPKTSREIAAVAFYQLCAGPLANLLTADQVGRLISIYEAEPIEKIAATELALSAVLAHPDLAQKLSFPAMQSLLTIALGESGPRHESAGRLMQILLTNPAFGRVAHPPLMLGYLVSLGALGSTTAAARLIRTLVQGPLGDAITPRQSHRFVERIAYSPGNESVLNGAALLAIGEHRPAHVTPELLTHLMETAVTLFDGAPALPGEDREVGYRTLLSILEAFLRHRPDIIGVLRPQELTRALDLMMHVHQGHVAALARAMNAGPAVLRRIAGAVQAAGGNSAQGPNDDVRAVIQELGEFERALLALPPEEYAVTAALIAMAIERRLLQVGLRLTGENALRQVAADVAAVREVIARIEQILDSYGRAIGIEPALRSFVVRLKPAILASTGTGPLEFSIAVQFMRPSLERFNAALEGNPVTNRYRAALRPSEDEIGARESPTLEYRLALTDQPGTSVVAYGVIYFIRNWIAAVLFDRPAADLNEIRRLAVRWSAFVDASLVVLSFVLLRFFVFSGGQTLWSTAGAAALAVFIYLAVHIIRVTGRDDEGERKLAPLWSDGHRAGTDIALNSVGAYLSQLLRFHAGFALASVIAARYSVIATVGIAALWLIAATLLHLRNNQEDESLFLRDGQFTAFMNLPAGSVLEVGLRGRAILRIVADPTKPERASVEFINPTGPDAASGGRRLRPGMVLTVGRSSQNDLPTSAASEFSRFHFTIQMNAAGQVRIQDLISTNGTAVRVARGFVDLRTERSETPARHVFISEESEAASLSILSRAPEVRNAPAYRGVPRTTVEFIRRVNQLDLRIARSAGVSRRFEFLKAHARVLSDRMSREATGPGHGHLRYHLDHPRAFADAVSYLLEAESLSHVSGNVLDAPLRRGLTFRYDGLEILRTVSRGGGRHTIYLIPGSERPAAEETMVGHDPVVFVVETDESGEAHTLQAMRAGVAGGDYRPLPFTIRVPFTGLISDHRLEFGEGLYGRPALRYDDARRRLEIIVGDGGRTPRRHFLTPREHDALISDAPGTPTDESDDEIDGTMFGTRGSVPVLVRLFDPLIGAKAYLRNAGKIESGAVAITALAVFLAAMDRLSGGFGLAAIAGIAVGAAFVAAHYVARGDSEDRFGFEVSFWKAAVIGGLQAGLIAALPLFASLGLGWGAASLALAGAFVIAAHESLNRLTSDADRNRALARRLLRTMKLESLRVEHSLERFYQRTGQENTPTLITKVSARRTLSETMREAREMRTVALAGGNPVRGALVVEDRFVDRVKSAPDLADVLGAGRLVIVPRSKGRTLAAIEAAVLAALRGVPSLRDSAEAEMARAQRKLLLPLGFSFPPAFAAGVDLSRYRIYMEIIDALSAVAIEVDREDLNDAGWGRAARAILSAA